MVFLAQFTPFRWNISLFLWPAGSVLYFLFWFAHMIITTNERDLLLWNQFKNGSREGFTTIFTTYYPFLFNYGCKITPDVTLVEDCIQELFLELWQTRGKAEIVSVRAYVFTAFKFKLLKMIARAGKLRLLGPEQHEHRFELSHEHFLVAREQGEEVQRKVSVALQQLSPRQKEVIYLKFYLGLDYQAIGELMGINYQVSRNLVYQAVRVLKETAMVVAIWGWGLCDW